MRRRSSRSRPEPENSLEEILRVAADSGDEAKLTRALARSEVYVAQLPEHPLPISEGKDGNPILLVFTSMAALLRWHTDDPDNQVWSLIPAGELFAALPATMSVFLNPADELNAVLGPELVRDVANLAAGEPVAAAYQPGPATAQQIGTPAEEPLELLAAVARAAARHHEVQAVHSGLTTLEEEDARIWSILGIRVADDLDDATYAAIEADVRSEVEAVTAEYVEIHRLRSGARGVDAWLLDTEPTYPGSAPAAAD
jgi:SseB protein N-terminal domain